MSYVTRYGTLHGVIPSQVGRVFWVAPSAEYSIGGRTYNASDDNDGLNPDRALRTINQAVTNAAADNGDVILLLPGTHTVTATQVINKSGLALVGAVGDRVHGPNDTPPGPLPVILTSAGTSDETLSIQSSNTEMGWIQLRPTSAFSGLVFDVNAALSGLYLHDLYVDLDTQTPNRATVGIDFGHRTNAVGGAKISVATTSIASGYLERITFSSGGANGCGLEVATAWLTIKNCLFRNWQGAWATAMRFATFADNCLLDSCVFTSTATMDVAIDGTDMTADVLSGVTIKDCYFHLGNGTTADAVRGFAAGEARLWNCFAGSTANGTSSETYITRMNG